MIVGNNNSWEQTAIYLVTLWTLLFKAVCDAVSACTWWCENEYHEGTKVITEWYRVNRVRRDKIACQVVSLVVLKLVKTPYLYKRNCVTEMQNYCIFLCSVDIIVRSFGNLSVVIDMYHNTTVHYVIVKFWLSFCVYSYDQKV